MINTHAPDGGGATARTRVALAYKLFGPKVGLSHVGLAIANVNTSKVLRANGIKSNVVGIRSAQELDEYVAANPQDHVIISAPWIPTEQLSDLSQKYPETHFSVVSHSGVSFLQADVNALRLIRQCMELEQVTHNVHLGGNNERFCNWVRGTFCVPCAYLPNLYSLSDESPYIHHAPLGRSGPLRVGIFGATRPQKNIMTGAAGALQLARSLRMPLELWLSGGRTEGGGNTILNAVTQMFDGLPDAAIKLNSWQPWTQFRTLVASMNLTVQVSSTETFNVVSADSIATGTPVVGGDCIEWLPKSWHANIDDASDVARVGRYLLHDPHAAQEGLTALKRYVHDGIAAYRKFLAA